MAERGVSPGPATRKAHHALDARRSARARSWPKQSSAPAAIRLSSTRLPTIRGSTRSQKSARSANGFSPRTSTMCSTPASPTPLMRRQRIEDAVVADLEVAARRHHRWRHDVDAEPDGVRAEVGQLVGVRHVERHRRGEELDRIVRLQVGGLVGDQRIGRGVALVEAVVGELRHQARRWFGLRLVDAALDGARDEALALLRPSRRGSSCPWRGAAGRLRRANSRHRSWAICITCSW